MSPAAQPAYRKVADTLRTDILRGQPAPGDPLPSERLLQERFGVSRQTVRDALDILRAEGRIVSAQGRGSFVRRQPIMRRLTTDLLEPGDQRGWYAAVARLGLQPQVQTSIQIIPAPPQMAGWLGVDPGADVLGRIRVMGVVGEPPTQLATSHIPLDLAERIPQLQQLDTGPGGMLARFEDAGFSLHFDEIVTARQPTPDETEALRLLAGTPVLVVHRITYGQDGRVLDAMERVIAADRCELAYRFGPSGG